MFYLLLKRNLFAFCFFYSTRVHKFNFPLQMCLITLHSSTHSMVCDTLPEKKKNSSNIWRRSAATLLEAPLALVPPLPFFDWSTDCLLKEAERRRPPPSGSGRYLTAGRGDCRAHVRLGVVNGKRAGRWESELRSRLKFAGASCRPGSSRVSGLRFTSAWAVFWEAATRRMPRKVSW